MNKKSYDIRRIAVLFIAVTIIISGLFFLRGGITGQAIFSEEENYTQRLDLEINNKSEYLWVLDNPGNLRSVKLSGLIEQKASAKVYLEHNNEKYLIFDSDELGEEELSKITGFVVSNKSNKQKNNDSDKNVSKDKKDKKSESNETTEEERINETSEEVIDETVEEEIINKTITIDLKYKSGSVYDTNDDGIETLTGVVDLTVENTEFNWDADEENICTRWNVYSIEDEESTSVCYGSQKCCNFVDLSAARPDWNELFYSAYGQYGSTSNNVISAQVLYVDYNLSVDDPFAEIHYSGWGDLNADYYDLISSFENICIDTCLLEGFNESEYRLIFEVDDGVLNIDTITYMVEEERNETKIDLEITPKITSKKKHFKFDEDIELDFEYLTETELISQGKSLEKLAKPKQTKKWVEDKETIETSVYDSSGRLTSIEPEIKELREGKFKITLPKQRAFKAGKYTIKLELVKDGITYTQEQDFTWGVLAINVNKSIYLPNENSFIGIAVLGDAGHMVCDADVTLEIIDPLNNKEILSTENGLISISPECEVYGVTNLPDYHTSYSVSGVGNYVMNLTAVTFNGVKSILDNFTVQSSVDFDVARHGPTRIYPLVPYYMNISIIANKNYNGVINEYVPASFDITQQDGLTVTTIGDSKVLSWNKNLVGGETYNLYYEFDAPDISPEFYLLGALEIGSFAETRNWMIASDTIDILFEGFETGSFADNGWTASGGTLNWVVDDGTESANYDGSLYHAHAENVDLMTVLETSISTFGYENVEFTFYAYTAGLDAGPPLEYISAEWSDGTDWTQILAPTQVIASYTKYGGSLAASADNNPDFKIRFNCTSGGPNELCAVDNVNISGTAVPDLTPPTITISLDDATPGFDQIVNVTATVNEVGGSDLDTCNFYTNMTSDGSFIILNKTVTGSSDECSQNFTISFTEGEVINFTVVVNDTSTDGPAGGNKAQDEQTITVGAITKVSQCRDLGMPNINYSLTKNVNASGTCFNVLANNITIDCKGYMINYSQSAIGHGINITTVNKTTIKSCDIMQADDGTPITASYGINIEKNSSKNIVFNNTITTYGTWSVGIMLFNYAYNNSIYNNSMTTSGATGRPLRLIGNIYNNFIYNNTMTSKSSTGYGIDLQIRVYDNSIYNNIVTTTQANGYGIYLSNTIYNNTIYNNTITTTGSSGYPIYLVQDIFNNSIYGNTMTTKTTGMIAYGSGGDVFSNFIYNNIITSTGQNSFAALWLYGFNADVYDNSIYGNTITTYNVSTSGIYLLNNVFNNTIYDNNITTKNASGSYGIYMRGVVNNNTFYRNTISSLAAGISINGSGQTQGSNAARAHTFTNDTIVPCTTGCADNYYDIILSNEVTDITFLNVSFNKSRIKFSPPVSTYTGLSNMTVKWYLDVNVTNSTDNKPMAGAWVMINDSFANVIFNSSTDATGGIPRQIVTEFTMNGSTNSSKLFASADTCVGITSHNITCFAPFNISVNFTGYNTKDISLDVNRSMFENISMVILDITPPVVNTTLNKSLTGIRGFDVINITANATDNTGLSFGQIIVNDTGFKRYFNFSLSGTSDQFSQNITITDENAVINFTARVNDTGNNFATNDTIVSVVNMIVNITLNTTTAETTDPISVSGHINLSNGTNVSNNIIKIWLDGERVRLDGEGIDVTETLRPNAPGDVCNFPTESGDACPNHYLNVDEAVSDDGSTMNRIQGESGNPYYQDLFHIEEPTGVGTINSVTVYIRVQQPYYAIYAYINIKPSDTTYKSTLITIPYDRTTYPYTLYSNTWTTNPDTNGAWAWDDIRNLQIGSNQTAWWLSSANWGEARTTQVYAVVSYSALSTNSSGNYNYTFNPPASLGKHTIKVNTTFDGIYGENSINFTVVDGILPIVNTTLNKSLTSIYENDIINLTANITDNVGLSFCQIIINQSGPTALTYINISLDGATSAQCSNKSKVNLAAGNVINYTIRVNDTSNNWRTNDTIITVATPLDTTKPIINGTLNKSTNIIFGDVINITANITDEIGLSFCQIIINQTGMEDIHIINVSLDGATSAQCSNKSDINAAVGTVINFTIRANDTSNNWRTNDTIITVALPLDTTKPRINGTLNKSAIMIFKNDVINATFNTTDETGLANGTIIINDTGVNRFFNFSLEGKTAAQFSQNFTISCSAGCVVNITGRVNDTSGNYAQNETIFTVIENSNFTSLVNRSGQRMEFGFGNGLLNQTFFNISANAIELEDNYYNGTYRSEIFDLGSNQPFKNISWTRGAPYNEEIGRAIGDNGSATDEDIFTNTSGLVLLMHFNNETDENDSLVKDFSVDVNSDRSGSTYNNGTCSGSVCPAYNFTSKKFGAAAMEFDGINDYVDAGDDKSLNISDAITIEAWVYPLSSGNGSIVSKYAGYDGYDLAINNSYLIFKYKNDSNHTVVINSNTELGTNQWYHIAFTQSGFYINGELKSSETKDTTTLINGTVKIGSSRRRNGTSGEIDDNWNGGAGFTSATRSRDWTISKPMWIHYFTTYHYNGGAGVPPGVISIKRASDDVVVGKCRSVSLYAAPTHHRCYPDMILPSGTYYVTDTADLWIYNTDSGGSEAGFLNVWGQSAVNNTFKGRIDEVAIWNRSLSAKEILDHYKRGTARLNLSVKSCDDAGCDTETFDINADNATGTDISSLSVNRYVQYRANFDTDNLDASPLLYNVTIHYGDAIAPVVNTTLNKSIDSIYLNDIINITANITDNLGLSFCQFIHNMTGIVNYTNVSLSGTSAQCSNTTEITVSAGNVINFTIRANDTSNNFRTNDTIITVASPPDTTKPRINASLDDSTPGFDQIVNITANVSDNVGLDTCNFYTNMTSDGSFIILNKTVTGTSDQCSQNYTISLPEGSVINFTVIVNDTATTPAGGNINQSIQIITVGAVTKVSQCRDLGMPNINYSLTKNVNASATCFIVKANNITIDCHGFIINYSQVDVGYGVNISSYNGTTIRSCDIYQSALGGSPTGGYAEGGSYGIYIYRNSSNNAVFNNSIETSGTIAYATYLFQEAYSNSIYNNSITTSGEGGYGVHLTQEAYNNSIYNNTITTSGSSSGYGVHLLTAVYDNSVYGNTITTSGEYGYGVFLFDNVYNNSVYSNTITTYENYGLGIRLNSAKDNSVYNNIVTSMGSGGVGLFLANFNYGNLIYSNTLTTNGSIAHGMYLNNMVTNNSIYNNTITTYNITSHGIYLYDTVYNNTFYDNNITTKNMTESFGIYMLYNVNNNTFYRNTISSLAAGIVINGTTPEYSSDEDTRFNIFTNDTIVPCTTGCSDNYYDIILTSNATDITFLNVSFNKSRISIVPRDTTAPVETNNLTVKWYLDVNVTNSTDNNPIVGAEIAINDSFDNTVYSGNTGATGGIPRQIVTEFTMNGSTNSSKLFTTDTCIGITSHNITCFAPFNISVNITGYNTKDISLDVNRSMFENISMVIIVPDIIPPRINASLDIITIAQYQVVNMTANVSDNVGLDTCNFYHNMTSDGSFIIWNKTVTGTNDQCSQNFTIDLPEGNVINFTVVVNDTSTATVGGNLNQTSQILRVGAFNCTTLYRSGFTYNLTTNVISDATCFNVKANNITIDCHGYMINYSQSVVGYGVNVSSQNFSTIKSCDIVQSALGGSPNNDAHGIYIYRNSSNNVVFNDTITTSGAQAHGIYLTEEVYNNSIYYNNITTSGEGVIASSDSGFDIYLTSTVYNTNIYSNTLTTSANAPFLQIGGSIYLSSEVYNNSIYNNTITTSGDDSIAIRLITNAYNNSIYDNIITTSGGYIIDYPMGIYLSDSVYGNSIYNNNITTGGDYGMGIGLIGMAYNNSIYNNNITTNGDNANGVWFFGFHIYNNSIYNNNIITRGASTGVSIIPSDYTNNNNKIYSNAITTSDGVGVSISSYAYHNFVYNNNITTNGDFGYGVGISSYAYNNSFYNNIIKTNGDFGYGVYLFKAYNNFIYDNNITTSGDSGSGLYLYYDVYNNSFYSNTITTFNVSSHGIHIDGTNFNNTFYDNNITTKNMTGSYGVYMLENVNNNTFYRNTISSLAAGIVINGSGQTAAQSTRFNTFTNDTIVPCTTGCSPSYYDIILTANATDITFLNVSFNKSRISIVDTGADTNNLTVQWYLDVNVTNSTDNNPIVGAEVKINDSFDTNLYSGNTDATGGIPRQIVTEFTMNGSTNSSKLFAAKDTCVGITSHNITCFAPFNISVNITSYNTKDVSLDVNRSMFENISMIITQLDTTPPTITIALDDSTPGFDQIVNVTADVADADSDVDTCNFYHNMTSDGSFVILNKTVAGSSDQCSQNFTISFTEGEVINFTILINDTSTDGPAGGNKAQDEQTITIGATTKVLGCRDLKSSINYSLTKNVNSSATCFNVMANNITINCKGYMINYSQSAVGYGVNVSSYNFTTIKSCDVYQSARGGSPKLSSYGIYIYRNSSNNVIFNNSIETSGDSGYAVYLFQEAYNNSVYNNSITTSGVGGYGVYLLQETYNNSIYGNTITTSGAYGYGAYLDTNVYDNSIYSNTIITTYNDGVSLFSNVYDNSIYNNTITTYSIGVSLSSNVYDNSIYGNTITTSNDDGYGVNLNDASNNSIYGNTITTNGASAYGLSLSSTANNSIYGNTITTYGAQGYGAYLDTNVYDNFIYKNNITTSNITSHGIYLKINTYNNTIYDNNITTKNMSSSFGIYLYYNINNNTFYRNTISSLAAGIVINGTTPEDSSDEDTRFNTFTNDTIVPCTTGCSDNYYDIILTSNVTDITFLNVSFNKSRISIVPRSTAGDSVEINNLTVKWYLDVNVTNSTDNKAIVGAEVKINDSFDTNLYSGNTDATGGIPRQIVTEFTMNGSTNSSILFAAKDTCVGITSHNITCFAPFNISVNITSYNTKDVSLDVNRSMFENISMVITSDTTPPVVNTTLNKSVTNIVFGDVINITANITDDVGLSFCQVIINQSGFNEIFNTSLNGATTAQCSNKSQVTVYGGNVINYTIRANDTSNNWRMNDTIITVVDNIVPVVNTTLNKSLTNIVYGDVINITANVTDEVMLSNGSIIINDTGFKRYFNFSVKDLTKAQFSQNITVSCFGGCVINFTAWVNDTSGNTRTNDTIITIVTGDTTPPGVNITNVNGSTDIRINDVLNISCEAFDIPTVGNITFNLTGSSNLYNFSFALTGTTANFSQNITMNLTRGNVVNATCWAADSTGNTAQNSTLVTVANRAPTAPNIVNTSGIYYNQNQTFNVTPSTDADGDTLTYFWFLNSSTDSYPNLVAYGVGTTNWTTNTTDTNVYYLFVNVSDGVVNVTSTLFNWTFDNVVPVVNTTLNKSITSIYHGDVINLTANVTDETGLSFCQIIINQSGPTALTYINISLDGATSAQCSNKSKVNLAAGNVINYTIRVNDTSNNWRTNDTIITVAVTPDLTSPVVNTTLNKSLTNIVFGDVINITANITDNLGLSFCQIIINQSGIKEIVNISLSGTTGQCSNSSKVTLFGGGVINYTIRVNDTSNNWRTNDTIITVVDDINPIINGTLNKSLTNILENDVINATFNTTDETGLSSGTLIINDTGFKRYFNFTLSGTGAKFSQNFTVNCSVGCVINVTGRVNDTSGNFQQNETIFTVVEEEIGPYCGNAICDAGEDCSSCSSDCGICSSDGGTGGGGGGGGTGGGRIMLEKEFSVNKDIIKTSILQGQTKTTELQIKNTGNVELQYSIEIQNLAKFIEVSEDSFKLKPGETKTITISFTASEAELPDVYSGKLVIKADGIEKNVITIIEVIGRKALFDISMIVDEDYKKVLRGQEVKFNINLTNLGTLKPVDVELYYAIKDLNENVISFKTESLAVEDKLSVERRLKIPKDMEENSYIVYSRVLYNGQIAASSDLFEVVEILPKVGAGFIPSIGVGTVIALILALVSLVILITLGEIHYFNITKERERERIHRKVQDMLEKKIKVKIITRPRPITLHSKRDIASLKLEELDSGGKKGFKVMDKGLLGAVMKKKPRHLDVKIYKEIIKLNKGGYEEDEIKEILLDKDHDLVDIDYAIETFNKRKNTKNK